MEDEDDFMLIDELIAVTNYVEQLEHDKSAQSVELHLSCSPAEDEPLPTTSPPEVDPETAPLSADDSELNAMPALNCTGEDSARSLFHPDGFLGQHFVKRKLVDKCRLQSLFDQPISEDLILCDEMLDWLFQSARKNIIILELAARENPKVIGQQSFGQRRHEVSEFLFTVWRLQRQNMLEPQPLISGLQSLEMHLGSIESMPIIKIVHTSCRIEGNDSTSPAYHLLHGQLEWRFLRLAIRCELYKSQSLDLDSMEEEFLKIIQDLVVLSVAKFNRLKRVDMLYSTPFVCTCIKEIWLLVQLLLESMQCAGALKSFWTYLNETLYRLRDKVDIYERIQQKPTCLRFIIPIKLQLDNWIEFSMWLICELAKLQGFDESGRFVGHTNTRIKDNFECLDNLLRDFLNADPNEDVLRVILYTVLPVLTKWWPPRTDVLLLFWEHFHKKLNSSFFLPGSAPSTLAVVNVSVIGYVNQMEQKIDSDSTVNPNETSFSLFIFLFGRILRRLAETDENQIKKIFGRITSKISVPKLLALNETGIHNLASLFLTLALTTKLSETGQRLQTILLQMPLAKLTTARQISLTRAHVALLILFARRRINIAAYAGKLLEQLGAIHQDDGHTQATRFLADGFVEIISANNEAPIGEQALFDAWLPRYLSVCSASENERILRCVQGMLTKSKAVMFALNAGDAQQQCSLLSVIYAVMLPYVLQTFVRPDSSRVHAELAANLCMGCSYAGSVHTFDELFAQFSESNVSNVQTLAAFLVMVLTADKQPTLNQTLIIQMWIKCHLCSTSTNVDMKSLTNIVVSLDEFRTMYTGDASEIINTRDPLCTFFSEIGQSYQNTNNFQKRNLISSKVHHYLQSFVNYVAAPLENPDNFMKIYSMIGIIILHCAPIVYAKGKNSCFFNVVMFQHLLPNHLLTGRPQKPQYVQAIHKVWHLLIMGIEKLDYKHDQHLVTVVTNLIEKWIPHFKTVQQKQFIGRPFINCIKECSDNMGTFVMCTIVNAFFLLQRRQPHPQCSLVLTIYLDIFNGVKHDQRKLIVLLRSSCAILMEHAMMVDETSASKNSIFEILENIFKHECYRQSNELKNIAISSLKTITTKHLAYFSSLYFAFMLRLVKINGSAVKSCIEFLRETISTVEVMRGAGRDGKLRNELDKLEGALLATSM